MSGLLFLGCVAEMFCHKCEWTDKEQKPIAEIKLTTWGLKEPLTQIHLWPATLFFCFCLWPAPLPRLVLVCLWSLRECQPLAGGCRLPGWLPDWLACWLTDWLTGRLADWLAGWRLHGEGLGRWGLEATKSVHACQHPRAAGITQVKITNDCHCRAKNLWL